MKEYPFHLLASRGLGFSNSSLQQIGDIVPHKPYGQAELEIGINLATGNLALSDRQHRLNEINSDTQLYYVYNNTQEPNKAWSYAIRRLLNPPKPDYSADTITLVEADGNQCTYTKKSDPFVHYAGASDKKGTPYLVTNSKGDGWIWYHPGEHTQQCFDQTGLLVQHSDDKGNLTQYEYDKGELLSITGPSKITLKITREDSGYSHPNETLFLIDETGKQTQLQKYKFDEHGRLSTSTVTVDKDTEYNIYYDYIGTTNTVQSITQNDATSITFVYDATGKVHQVVTGNKQTCYQLDYTDQPIIHFSVPGCATVDITLDEAQRIKELTRYSGFTTLTTPTKTSYAYNDQGQLATITSADGGKEQFEYESKLFDVISKHQRPDGQITQYHYDDNIKRPYLNTRESTYTEGKTSAVERYVYSHTGADETYQSVLLFHLSAEGRVTQFEPNELGLAKSKKEYADTRFDVTKLAVDAVPTIADIQDWIKTTNLAKTTLVEYEYDSHGLVKELTEYATVDANGSGVKDDSMAHSLYSWDSFGNQLTKQIRIKDDKYAQTTQTFDGLQRLTSSKDAMEYETTLEYKLSTYLYIYKTLPNGTINKSNFDAEGNLIAFQVEATVAERTTSFTPDKAGRTFMITHPDERITYQFFNQSDQLQYEISATGLVVEHLYNETPRYHQKTTYSKAIDISQVSESTTGEQIQLLVNSKKTPSQDRIEYTLYDSSNRKHIVIDAKLFVTQFIYDSLDRDIAEIKFATALSPAQLQTLLTTGSCELTYNAAIDRCTSSYYDLDGLLIGKVDSEGWVTEYTFDGAFCKQKQLAYATKQQLAVRPIDFDKIRPAKTADDAATYYFYNALGLVICHLNAKGFITTKNYYPNKQLKTNYQYITAIDPSWFLDPSKMPALPASNSEDLEHQFEYDALGQQVAMSASNQFASTDKYDFMGKTIYHSEYDSRYADDPQKMLSGDYIRTSETIYDDLEQKVRVLDPLLEQKIALIQADPKIPPTDKQAQINILRNRGSESYTYDKTTGLLTIVTKDSDNFTNYGYDQERRKIVEIDAEGRIVEYQYNSFSEIVSVRRHVTKNTSISIDGFVNQTTQDEIIANRTDKDAITSHQYDQRGQQSNHTDPEGCITTYTYSAFRQESNKLLPLTTTKPEISVTTQYNLLGKVTHLIKENGSLKTLVISEYNNLYGKLTKQTNELGDSTSFEYDVLGNQHKTIGPDDLTLSEHEHDALGRIFTEKDALGRLTSHTYQQAFRQHTVTPPLAANKYSFQSNIFEQQLVKIDTLGNTLQWQHSPHSEIAAVIDQLGRTVETRQYDLQGRLVCYYDAVQTLTKYSYDKSGVLYIKEVDDNVFRSTRYDTDGLARTTQLTYNSNDPEVYEYDRCSRNTVKYSSSLTLEDKTTIKLTNRYSYDSQGHKKATMQGDTKSPNQYLVQFNFDELGRKTGKIIDPLDPNNPNTLQLQTQHLLDLKGRTQCSIDAKGNKTWIIYDAYDRKRFVIKPSGSVQAKQYDQVGNLIQTRKLAAAIDTSTLTTATTLAQMQTTVASSISNLDTQNYFFYDELNQQRFKIRLVFDPEAKKFYGHVLETSFDQLSHKNKVTAYANPIDASTLDKLHTTDIEKLVAAIEDKTQDRCKYYAFDASGQQRFLVDAENYITEQQFDAKGRIIEIINYATPLPDPTLLTTKPLADVIKAVDAIANPALDQHEYTYYSSSDSVPSYSVDAEGGVTAYEHNFKKQITKKAAFAESVTVPQEYSALLAAIEKLTADYNEDRIETYEIDSAYRVTSKVLYYAKSLAHNYLGIPIKHIFDRDSLGNVICHHDGEEQKWSFQYDRANRLKLKTSPAAVITSVQADSSSKLTTSQTTRAVKEFHDYDANNNVTVITKDYQGDDPRSVHFDYTTDNKMKLTTSVGIEVDDPTKPTSFTARPTKTVNITIKKTYNPKGLLITEQNKKGYWKFYAYNSAEHLCFQVNADGTVIAFERNVFGEVTCKTQYATKLTIDLSKYTETGLSIDDISQNLQDSNQDRVELFTYNKRGLVITHVEGVNKTTKAGQILYCRPDGTSGMHYALTQRDYNAYQQIIRKRQLVFADPLVWHDTYTWYDRNNIKLASAESVRQSLTTALAYRVKRYQNNAFHEQVQTVSYAAPFTTELSLTTTLADLDKAAKQFASPKDVVRFRIMDQMGNVYQEGVKNALRQQVKDNVLTDITLPSLSEGKCYDRNGLLCAKGTGIVGDWEPTILSDVPWSIRDARGLVTQQFSQGTAYSSLPSYYASRFTEFGVDAHGKTVRIYRYFIESNRHGPVAPSMDPQDQEEILLLDARSLKAVHQDAKGYLQGFSHAASGEIVRSWSTLTNWEQKATVVNLDTKQVVFDDAGRPQQTILLRDNVVQQTTATDYNTFGETIGQGPGDGTFPAFQHNDLLGRPWLANFNQHLQDGATTISLYDLTGNVTGLIQAEKTDLSALTEDKLPDFLNNLPADVEVTRKYRDEAGRILRLQLPSYAAAPETHSTTLPLELYVSRDFAKEFGAVSITWVAPIETNVTPEFILGDGAKPTIIPIKTNNGRCGVDVSTVTTDQYPFTINFYLLDPVTQEPDKTTPLYQTKGQVAVVTDNSDHSQSIVPYVTDDHVLHLAGKVAELTAIELWQEAKLIATVPVKYDPTKKECIVDLAAQISGVYQLKPKIQSTVVDDLSLPFTINTTQLASTPLSREIPCTLQLATLATHAELDIWNSLPVDFQALPVNYTCSYVDNTGTTQTETGVLTSASPRTIYKDKNGSEIKANIELKHDVTKITSMTLSLQLSADEQVLLYNHEAPQSTQAHTADFSIHARGESKQTQLASIADKPFQEEKDDEWDIVLPDEDLTDCLTFDGDELEQAVTADDTITTAFFMPRVIIYIRPLAGLVTTPTIQFLDVRDDRLASWKSLQASAITKIGLVLDATGLAPGQYPFILPDGDKQNPYLFTVAHDGVVFASTDNDSSLQDRTQLRIRSYELDNSDNVIKYTDAMGQVFARDYNESKQVTRLISPKITVYGADGVAVKDFQPITLYGFDNYGHQIATQNPAGALEQWEISATGKLLSYTNGEAKKTENYVYDIFDRVIKFTFATVSRGVTYEYDKRNNPTNITIDTDKGEVYQDKDYAFVRTFNERNLLDSDEIDGQLYRYSYSVSGEVVARYFCDRPPTQWQYKRANQKVKQINPDGSTLSWQPDDKLGYFGVMQTRTDLSGAIYTMKYNGLLQLTHVSSAGGSHGSCYQLTVEATSHGPDVFYTDGYSIKKITTPSQNLQFTYSGGEIIKVQDVGHGISSFFNYDLEGRRTLLEVRSQEGALIKSANSELDALGRETQIYDTALTGSLGYDRSGNRRFIAFSLGGVSEQHWYDYNKAAQITIDDGVLSGGKIQISKGRGRTFEYTGSRRSQEISIDDKGNQTTQLIDYYPASNRLKSVKVSGTNLEDTETYMPSGTIWTHAETKQEGSQLVPRTTTYSYREDGFNTQVQQTRDDSSPVKTELLTVYTPNAAYGTAKLVTTDSRQDPTVTYSFDYSFVNFDEPQLAQVVGTTLAPGPKNTSVSHLLYDANGNINAKLGVEKQGKTPAGVYFLTTFDGVVLRRLLFPENSASASIGFWSAGSYPFYTAQGFYLCSYEIKANSAALALTANSGALSLYSGTNAKGQVTGITSSESQYSTQQDSGFIKSALFRNVLAGDFKGHGTLQHNFHLADPITEVKALLEKPAVTQYTIQTKGEDYASIAKSLFTDPAMADSLAQINGDLPNAALIPGVTLRIPRFIPMHYTDKTRIANSELVEQFVGSVTPLLKWSITGKQNGKGKGKCLDLIVEIVASVVVSIVAPELAPMLGIESSVGIGIVASVLDAGIQGVAMGVGLLSHFSLENVLEAGIGAAVSAKFKMWGDEWKAASHEAELTQSQQFILQIGKTASTNIITQLTELELDFKKKIDLKSLISAIASSALDYSVNLKVNTLMSGTDAKIMQDITNSSIDMLTQAAIMGAPIDLEMLAAQIIGSEVGQAIGNSVVDQLPLPPKKAPTRVHQLNHVKQSLPDYHKAMAKMQGFSPESDKYLSDLEAYYEGDSSFGLLEDLDQEQNQSPPQKQAAAPPTKEELQKTQDSLTRTKAELASYYYAGYGTDVQEAQVALFWAMNEPIFAAASSTQAAPTPVTSQKGFIDSWYEAQTKAINAMDNAIDYATSHPAEAATSIYKSALTGFNAAVAATNNLIFHPFDTLNKVEDKAWSAGKTIVSGTSQQRGELANRTSISAVTLLAGGSLWARRGVDSRIFKPGEDIIHFEKHGQQVANKLNLGNDYDVNQYVADANRVINEGIYVPELKGYVKIPTGTGSAQAPFVGIDRETGEITTFHLKPVKFFEQRAPSLGWTAKPRSELTDLIGPDKELGWKPPYGGMQP